jgi:hypothetical protein
MQVQEPIGNAGDGKTSKLQEIQDPLIEAGHLTPIIQAGAYEEGLSGRWATRAHSQADLMVCKVSHAVSKAKEDSRCE